MKVFLVYDNYGHSGDPRPEDVQKIFIGEDMKEECEKYCHEINKQVDGGYDYEEVDVDITMNIK